jgi:uncharacterized membrane protein YhaH (DUF805 family)
MMGGFLQNYVGFEGRLNRQPFWIGAIVLAIVAAIVQFIVLQLLGGGGIIDVQALLSSGKTTQEIVDMFGALAAKSGIAGLITLILFAYPSAALSIKRRHDRGSGGLEVWIYLALGALLTIVQLSGLGMTTTEFNGITFPAPTPLFSVLGLIAAILGIYLLVVMGFLRGTPGTNAYGPDPLGG